MTPVANTTDQSRSSASHDRRGKPDTSDQARDPEGAITEMLQASPAVTQHNDCPAYRIGAQLGRLVALHSALDSGGREEDADAERERDLRMKRADDSADLLRESISYERATSLAGALAQIVAASQFLSDTVENGDLDEAGRESRVEATRRCLFSAAHVIVASSGVSARALGADYFMPQWLDTVSNAWAEPKSSYVQSGPKPTVDDLDCGEGGFVERRLLALNRTGEAWARIYSAAGRREAEAEEAVPRDIVKLKMAEMATAHAVRLGREALARAVGMPASTLRELGLQARLVGAELDEWWDNNDLPAGELACRLLLDRLIAFSGLPPIERGDVDLSEAQSWLDDPAQHASKYHPDLSGDAP